jgi:hypothetical protein
MAQINKQTKVATAEAIIAKLDSLAAQCAAFQAQYDQVNDTLYDLLAECLDLYLMTKGNKAEKEVLDLIKAEFAKHGIKIDPYSTVLSLIVRYMFVHEKHSVKRLNAYVRALSCAIQSNQTSATFAAYVKSFGDVDDVVFVQGVKPETQLKRNIHDAQVSTVEDELSTCNALAMVPPSPLVPHVKTGAYTLLIGRTLLSGETEVLSVVPNSSSAMIKQAIAKIADAEIAHAKAVAAANQAQVAESAVEVTDAQVTAPAVEVTQAQVTAPAVEVTQATVQAAFNDDNTLLGNIAA